MHTYQRLINRLHKKIVFPQKHFLDYKASAKCKEVIRNNGMEYELVLPHMYLQNLAEREIHTLKDIFVGILNGLPDLFHWQLWYELLPQVNININLLRQSNVAPTSSCSVYSIHGWYTGTSMEHYWDFKFGPRKKGEEDLQHVFLTQIPHSAHCDTGRCGGEVTEVPQKTYHH